MIPRDVKVFYGYPGKNFFSYDLKTGEYAIYLSKEEREPSAAVNRALKRIEDHRKAVVAP